MYTEEIGNVDGKYNMAHRHHEVMSQFFYLQVPYSSVIRSVVTFTKVRMLVGWMLLGVLGC